MAKYKNSSSVKAYVANLLKRDVMTGIYRAGDRLPAERKLCEKLSISRGTLRTALLSLSKQGLLTPCRGSGWKVTGMGPGGHPKTIAVLMPEGPYNLEMYKTIATELRPHGYAAAYVPAGKIMEKLENVSDYYDVRNASGVIFSSGSGIKKSILDELNGAGLKFICPTYSACSGTYDSVSIDHDSGVGLVLDHLFKLGHENIVYVSHDFQGDPSFPVKRSAFERRMRENGRNPVIIDVEEDYWFFPDTEKFIAKRLKGLRPRPDAVLCGTSYFASQLLVILHRMGWDVPLKISLAMLGSTYQITYPGLDGVTCYELDPVLTGKATVKRLMDRMEKGDDSPPSLTVLPPAFRAFSSTRNLKA